MAVAVAVAVASDDGAADQPVRLSARPNNETWDVAINGVPIAVACREVEMAPLLEVALTDVAVRMRCDRIAFHAGAVAFAGQTVLFIANKGSGKSTLSAWLGDHQATYCGDEVVFVHLENRQLEPFPKAATLKHGSFFLFAKSPTYEDPIRGELRYHLPKEWASPELSASHVAQDCANSNVRDSLESLAPPTLLVFPRYDRKAENPAITELSPEATALALVQQTFGGLERDPRIMDCLVDLAEIPSFEIAYSSTEGAAAAIRGLLGE